LIAHIWKASITDFKEGYYKTKMAQR